MRRLGCLAVLVVLAIAGWFYRDRLIGLVAGRGDETPASTEIVWERLTPQGAERARVAVQSLSDTRGPVFTSVRAGDLASYIFSELAKQLPPSADSVEAAVIGKELHVRAVMRLSDFGGSRTLGPLAAMLGERERVQFGGVLGILRPGLAEYRVSLLRLGDLNMPKAMIPRLLRRIERGARPDGLSPDGLPLVVPGFIGDVRIDKGRVVLYKTAAPAT